MSSQTLIDDFKKALSVPNLNIIPELLKNKSLWNNKNTYYQTIYPVQFGNKNRSRGISKANLESFWDDLKNTYGGDNDTIEMKYIENFFDLDVNIGLYKEVVHIIETHTQELDEFTAQELRPRSGLELLQVISEIKNDGNFIIDNSTQYPKLVSGSTIFRKDWFAMTVSDIIAKHNMTLPKPESLFDILVSWDYIIEIREEEADKVAMYAFKDVHKVESEFFEFCEKSLTTLLAEPILTGHAFKLSPSQEEALTKAVTTDKMVVGHAGEAGSGKTAIANAIRQHYPNEKVVYLAPTGKATLVLQENGCVPAMTISRGAHAISQDSTIIVIDESSMINTLYAKQLLMILKDRCKPKKVIFMGDRYQCQPVGAGAYFHSLLTHYSDRFTELTEQHRCHDDKYINNLRRFREKMTHSYSAGAFNWIPVTLDGRSDKVINGYDTIDQMLTIPTEMERKYLMDMNASILTHSNRLALFASFWLARHEYPPETRKAIEEAGLDTLYTKTKVERKNVARKLGEAVKHLDYWIKKEGYYFIKGHKVICCRNIYRDKKGSENPTHGVKDTDAIDSLIANGTVLKVTEVDRVNGYAILADRYMVDLYEHAFRPATCITVHKAQGSAFDDVIYLHASHTVPADVVYTAMTRTRGSMDVRYLDTFGNGGVPYASKTKPRYSSLDV